MSKSGKSHKYGWVCNACKNVTPWGTNSCVRCGKHWHARSSQHSGNEARRSEDDEPSRRASALEHFRKITDGARQSEAQAAAAKLERERQMRFQVGQPDQSKSRRALLEAAARPGQRMLYEVPGWRLDGAG